jgi:small subunit ribosomal protein S20
MLNRSQKTELRGMIRHLRASADAGEIEKAEAEFRVVGKKLDQAGAKRLIHPNKASRLKSRISRMLKAAKNSGE